MKTLTSKQIARKEKKKEKMAALVTVSKLNDEDNDKKSETSNITIEDSIESSAPPRKRKKGEPESNQVTSDETANLNCKEENTEAALKSLNAEVRVIKNSRAKISFRLNAAGEEASLDTVQASRVPLLFSDIQSLLLHCLMGEHSPCPPRWYVLNRQNKICHTVVSVFDGLSVEHFLQYKNNFTIFNQTEFKLEVVTPSLYGGSLVEDLATVPLSDAEMENFIEKYGSMDVAIKSRKDLMIMMKAVFPINGTLTSRNDSFSRTQLLLSPSQLLEENYPLPLKGKLKQAYADYVMTKDVYEPVHSNSPMFALDCEMCMTSMGNELTRVSIVDEDHKTIYESFVLPYNKIINYLTQYSGITRESLVGVTKRLEDVQRDLRLLLPSDSILVGQSLNSDFHALKIMHPYIIDTSVVFNITGVRGRKTKLKTLSEEFLSEKIQTGNDGHCSVEDSLACMKLIQLKLNKTLDFGDAVLESKKKMEIKNIEKKLEATPHYSTTIFNHMAQQKMSSMIVGCEDVTGDYHQHLTLANDSLVSLSLSKKGRPKKVKLYTMESQEEVVEKMCTSSQERNFSMSHMKIDETISEELFKKINDWTSKIWESLPLNSLFVVIFGGTKSENGLTFVKFKT